MKYIYITIATLIVLIGCNKPDPILPISTSDMPEFFVKGIINNVDSLTFSAGKDGMYMYTLWEQSKYNAVDSAYQFQGIMAPAACNTCNPRFAIVFVDSIKSSKGQSSSIQSFLVPKNFNFIGNALQKGGVYITYTIPSGVNYVSRKSNAQPAFANFELIKVEEYKESNGVKTKKVQVKFSCRCYNTANDYVDLKNMEATFAIGYKF